VYMNGELCLECITLKREESEKQARVKNTEQYMTRWGFPKRFMGWEKEKLLPVLQKLIDNCIAEKGLFLTGTCGKTCFATVIGKGLIRTGGEVWFKNVTDLLFEVKGTFDKDSKTFNNHKIIYKWAGKPYLILDDLGAEKVSEAVRQSLYVLINKRYVAALPTIVTSNLTLDGIAGRLDDRIASRLTEMCRVVHLGNKDLRVYEGGQT